MPRVPDFDELIASPSRIAPAPPRRVAVGSRPRIDEWWGRMLRTPRRRRAWLWCGPAAVTLLAAVLRLWDLGRPGTLVFDETYYVKDAFSMLRLGYEGQWPAEADARFVAGDVDIFTATGEYVAHPPLGKWIIALGLQVFGAEDPVGWRISTAVIGVLAVALVCAVAFALFRSALLATIAGGLLATDGLAIAMSRTALLDGPLQLLTLLGVGAVLLDRKQSAEDLAAWTARRRAADRTTDWGPALWDRPWLLTAGLFFGFASAVKWSGLYFLAAFAVYVLLADAMARRRAGVAFWFSSVVFRQAPVNFLLMVPIAVIAYVTSWTGWLLTDGGWGRDWADQEAARLGEAPLPWVVAAARSLWHYQVTMYNSNVGLSTPHNYQANPLTWLLMTDPTVFLRASTPSGEDGCRYSVCADVVTTLANPLLWWLSVAALGVAVWLFAGKRNWQAGLLLTGVAAGYLPWLLYLDRTVFQFYTLVFLPYLVLAFTAVLGLVLGSRDDPPERRRSGILLVAVLLSLIVLLAAFEYPLATGTRVPEWFQRLHYWMPGWV